MLSKSEPLKTENEKPFICPTSLEKLEKDFFELVVNQKLEAAKVTALEKLKEPRRSQLLGIAKIFNELEQIKQAEFAADVKIKMIENRKILIALGALLKLQQEIEEHYAKWYMDPRGGHLTKGSDVCISIDKVIQQVLEEKTDSAGNVIAEINKVDQKTRDAASAALAEHNKHFAEKMVELRAKQDVYEARCLREEREDLLDSIKEIKSTRRDYKDYDPGLFSDAAMKAFQYATEARKNQNAIAAAARNPQSDYSKALEKARKKLDPDNNNVQDESAHRYSIRR